MSTISVYGALTPLHEGEYVLDDKWRRLHRCYIGGQTERSWTIAWQLLENLLDCRPDWTTNDSHLAVSHNPIIRCASLRFGNCLTFSVTRRP